MSRIKNCYMADTFQNKYNIGCKANSHGILPSDEK